MESCDPVGTLMEIKDKLDLDQNGSPVDATKYRSMIGALIYLTSSRPDIVHATYLCARYQVKPTEKHLKEVKRIFCYLRGTVNMGLWYTKDSSFELTGFSYADYAGFIWMRTQLTDYGFHFNKIPIYCDSESAIAISCNPVQHSRTKYIVVRYHFIKEHVEKGTIELYLVKTDYQLADLFTKALLVDRFNYLVRRLGMHNFSPRELERLAKSRVNIKQLRVLENIESKDSYVSNLDEPALLVTPLSDFNKDECFNPGGDVNEIELLLQHNISTPKMRVVSILEGFTNEPPLKENDDLFDL
ncbi:hypothetical protein Tco_0324750 [Tanacetum coccineum]